MTPQIVGWGTKPLAVPLRITVMTKTHAARPLPRHLLSPETLARSADIRADVDLTRHHGQGNGVRVHAVYFALVSLVGLLLVIVAASLAVTMM